MTALLACATGCASHPEPDAQPPGLLQGAFVDDYGIGYRISAQEWQQLPNTRYRIVRWKPAAQYLIAQNVSTNASDPGLWTRIDWMPLPGMPPYDWAFCLSTYDAPTLEAAEQAAIANRGTPKTGCNGYPFSRMQRVEPHNHGP